MKSSYDVNWGCIKEMLKRNEYYNGYKIKVSYGMYRCQLKSATSSIYLSTLVNDPFDSSQHELRMKLA